MHHHAKQEIQEDAGKRNCEIRVWKNLFLATCPWRHNAELQLLSLRWTQYMQTISIRLTHCMQTTSMWIFLLCFYNFKKLRNLGQSTAAPDLKSFQIFWVGHMLHFELAACSLCIFPHRGSFSPLCLPNKPHSLLSHLKGFLSTFLQILRHLVKRRPQEYL